MPASDVQVLREPAHRFLQDRRPLAIAVLHLNPGEIEAGVGHSAIDVGVRRGDRAADDRLASFELELHGVA